MLSNVNSDNNYIEESAFLLDLVITEWALNAYLELKHKRVFTDEEYQLKIRPDVLLLQDGIPACHSKFESNKFWGPVTDKSSNTISSAYKMKWRQIGPGRVQLRLLIFVHQEQILLCRAYVKSNENVDKREAARLKIHIKDILHGNYVTRGKL